MIVTFCGHGTLKDREKIEKWLYSVTEKLILNGETIFYLGGYGEFDNLVKSVLCVHKKTYPNIKIVLILAYLNSSICQKGYCYTLYPPIETVPLRFAILKRNQYMVAKADIIVACVTHNWGGADKTLLFAKRKNIKIISYTEEET